MADVGYEIYAYEVLHTTQAMDMRKQEGKQMGQGTAKLLGRSPCRDVHDLTEGLCQTFHLKSKLSVVEVGAGVDINSRLAGSHG